MTLNPLDRAALGLRRKVVGKAKRGIGKLVDLYRSRKKNVKRRSSY